MPDDRTKRRGWETALPALLFLAAIFADRTGFARAAATTTKEAAAPGDDLTSAIDQLNQQVSKRKAEIEQLKSQMASYRAALEQKRTEAASVQNELAIADNKIASTELDIKANKLEMNATDLELRRIDSQIQDETLKIMRQRAILSRYLRSIGKNDRHSSIDLLLTKTTLSDFFNDAQFLVESQRELKRALDGIEKLKVGLEDQQADQSAKKAHLAVIEKQLADAQATLTEQRSAKAALANQLQATQARYQYDLARLQKEVNNANDDVAATERRLRKALDESKLRKISGSSTGWMWPVPSMIVTTYFHDPDYPFRYVFEHPAIDIRAAQGTPVRAARGGYVARAKDAGMGYSYVMLVHDDGLSTVYGHVSKILAKEDTYVEQGDTIALSGGAPGTPGAGPLTTAPHLHFEIRQGGIPVDPLNYLQR